jgi:hypothetical protein
VGLCFVIYIVVVGFSFAGLGSCFVMGILVLSLFCEGLCFVTCSRYIITFEKTGTIYGKNYVVEHQRIFGI